MKPIEHDDDDTKRTIALSLDPGLVVILNNEASRRGTSVEKTIVDLLLLALLEIGLGRISEDDPQESER